MTTSVIAFDALATADLRVDTTYEGRTTGTAADDLLARLLPAGNQGGFRYKTHQSRKGYSFPSSAPKSPIRTGRTILTTTRGASPSTVTTSDPATRSTARHAEATALSGPSSTRSMPLRLGATRSRPSSSSARRGRAGV